MVKCKNCKSMKIMRLAIPSQTVQAFGNYHLVNTKQYYSGEEKYYDSSDSPKIDLYHCLKCDFIFNEPSNEVNSDSDSDSDIDSHNHNELRRLLGGII